MIRFTIAILIMLAVLAGAVWANGRGKPWATPWQVSKMGAQ